MELLINNEVYKVEGNAQIESNNTVTDFASNGEDRIKIYWDLHQEWLDGNQEDMEDCCDWDAPYCREYLNLEVI